jgi:hypothetical protein
LTAEAARNRLAIGMYIASRVDWRTLRSRPGYAAILAHTAVLGLGRSGGGLSERCVQEHVRAIEAAGWLAVLEPGTTPQFRPRVLHPGGCNLAREWMLTRATPKICTPSHPPTAGGWYAGARGAASTRPGQPEPRSGGRCAADSSPPPSHRQAWVPPWPLGRKPQRRRQALAACESLRGCRPVLAGLSARDMRSACRPFWFCDVPGRDWTPAAILAVVDAAARGPVYAPGEWFRHVLGAYLDADGRPLPPPHLDETGVRAAALTPAGAEIARARAEADTARQARAAQLRSIPVREHTAAQWRPEPRPGDPSRWAATARAQVAESRAARPPAGEPPPPAAVTVAELAAVARRGAADEAEAARRLRALAQVAAFRRGRERDRL